MFLFLKWIYFIALLWSSCEYCSFFDLSLFLLLGWYEKAPAVKIVNFEFADKRFVCAVPVCWAYQLSVSAFRTGILLGQRR